MAVESQQLKLVLRTVLPQLAGCIHVDMLPESIINEGIWLADVKRGVPCICGITNQGKILGGEGEGIRGRNKCTHKL